MKVKQDSSLALSRNRNFELRNMSIYRVAYLPHYRLMNAEQFQRLGLNLSERRK